MNNLNLYASVQDLEQPKVQLIRNPYCQYTNYNLHCNKLALVIQLANVTF